MNHGLLVPVRPARTIVGATVHPSRRGPHQLLWPRGTCVVDVLLKHATGARVRLLLAALAALAALAVLAVGVAGALASTSASAQATIDQNKALAGGVTPGFPITVDAPGHCGVTIAT